MSLGLVMSVSLVSPAKAFDPFTLIGAIASPIFCKLISCRSTETVIVQPSANKTAAFKRLAEMKSEFQWEVPNEQCVEYTTEEGEHGRACKSPSQGWTLSE